MYAQRSRKVKTDRRDARALAEACLLGAYRRAHRVSDRQRHVRGRLTVRHALVRTRTSYITVIRSLLRQHGWRVRSGGAEAFIARVRELPPPGGLLSEIAPLLAVMRAVTSASADSSRDQQFELDRGRPLHRRISKRRFALRQLSPFSLYQPPPSPHPSAWPPA
jgi:transposase